MKKKTVVLLMLLVLIVGGVIGGTLAWLLDTTDPVENTFSPSNIDITLTEKADNFKMVPGHTIDKDPKVTVLANSEKAYVFVKLEKSSNFDTYMTYAIADGWTQLNGETDVYYRIVEASEADQAFYVLEDNQVKVKDDVTKEKMDKFSAATDPEPKPTLTVTAFAAQYEKSNDSAFTAAEAWALKPQPQP